jgi:ribokinase
MAAHRVDVLVIGGANFDYLVKAPKLPGPGDTVVGEGLVEAPGGKGANQAVAAARLGARVAFAGRIGADERGRRILGQLADEQVDTSRCVRDPEAPTGVALIAVDAHGEKLIATAPGANRRLTIADVERAAAAFAARVLLIQLEAGVEIALAAARRGRANRAFVVADLAPPEPVPDELLGAIDVVRCNLREAQILTGVAGEGVDAARRAGQELRQRGAGAACVGATGGDLLVFETDELWLPQLHVEAGLAIGERREAEALPRRVIDTTGAGDAFTAGIAVGLAEGKSLSDAAWLGCAAAALKTTRLGAQAGLPRRDEVERLLATISRD